MRVIHSTPMRTILSTLATLESEDANDSNMRASIVRELRAQVKELQRRIPEYAIEFKEDLRTQYFDDLTNLLDAKAGSALAYATQQYTPEFFENSDTPVFDAALKSYLVAHFGDSSLQLWKS